MVCRIVSVVVAVVLVAVELPAQDAVLLRLRPRLGDTLHMRFEQQMEMRGRPQGATEAERVMTSSMRVRARAIPTGLAGGATILTTITDSLIVSTPIPPEMDRARRALLGREKEVRVQSDGAIEVVNRDEHQDDVSPLLGQMPPVLPAVAVRPGDQWVREMRLPIRSSRGTPATVRATFRLDSLGRGERVAFISVRGAFYERPPGGGDERPTEGVLTGAIEFDRDLGWISDMRTTVTTRSDVRRPDRGPPQMTIWMRITQRLQARIAP